MPNLFADIVPVAFAEPIRTPTKIKPKKSILDILTDITIKTEGLSEGKTPLMISTPEMRKWKHIKGIPVVPNPKSKFFHVAPEQVPKVIRRQWKTYITTPEKLGVGLTQESTLEEAIKKFDQTKPENKIYYLRKQGIDVKQKIKDLGKTFDLTRLNPFRVGTAEAARTNLFADIVTGPKVEPEKNLFADIVQERPTPQAITLKDPLISFPGMLEDIKEIPAAKRALVSLLGPAGIAMPEGRKMLAPIMEGLRRITEMVKAPLYEYQKAVAEERPKLEPITKAIGQAAKGLRITPGTEIVKGMGVPLDNPDWVTKNPGKHFAAQMLGAWYETYGTDPIILTFWAKSVPYARKAALFNQLVKETGQKINPALLDKAKIPLSPKVANKLSRHFGKGFWSRQTQIAGGLEKVTEAELKQAIKAVRGMEYIAKPTPAKLAVPPGLVPVGPKPPAPVAPRVVPPAPITPAVVAPKFVGKPEITPTPEQLEAGFVPEKKVKPKFVTAPAKPIEPKIKLPVEPEEPVIGHKLPLETQIKNVQKRINELEAIKEPTQRIEEELENIREFLKELKAKRPISITSGAMATSAQKSLAHIIAKKKALITLKGKVKPGYRRLARAMTGKSSMREMTKEQAESFIKSLKGLSEPYYKKGKLVPPSIPKSTRLVTQDFFKRKFKEPTIAKLFTSQTYYSQLLGVKPFVEPLEIAKQKFDLAYREKVVDVDKVIAKINKISKTTLSEFAQAKIKNIPTKAVSKMRDVLDKYEEAPDFLSSEEKEVFNWFRSLSRTTREAENVVRKSLDLEPIKYRKAYVRHTADVMAQEMLLGRYPFPEGLKYWSQKIIGKKIFNPMEFQRQLADDLESLWTKDLGHATKSMLYTALKEIHLSQPLKLLNEQLGAVSKDPLVYKNLTPEEKEIYDQQMTMPASTKKWLIDYVNQVIKGQETDLDASINRLVTTSGLNGIFNKFLAPFGRTVGRKPLTGLFQMMGRLTIHGVMGPIRPKQLIRNKFQLVQNLALYGLKANLKGFFPATKQIKQLINESLFLKTYTGFEELPTNLQAKIERLNLAPFQWTAVSNISQTMKVAYWDTLDLITNPKYKEFGWADSKRTYTESREFLYPSEKEKILREMEFGAGITQYGYIPMAMPEIFRYKTLIPFTRLQSWWMNHFFKFNREAIMRGLKGETGYGAKLPWSRRIGWFKYLLLGGFILNTLDYERSFLFGAAPTGLPPTAQLMLGLYTYLTIGEKTDWAKKKKAEAKRQIFYAMRTFIPGYLAWKDFKALMSGKNQLEEYFFYKKIRKRKVKNVPRFTGGMPKSEIPKFKVPRLKPPRFTGQGF